MGVVLVAMMVAGGSLAYSEDCSCHGVPTDHPVLAGGAIRVTAASATVTTKSGSTVVDLKAGGNASLGNVALADIVSISFKVVANDPDDDVCEAGDSDAYAKLTSTLKLSIGGVQVVMTSSGGGVWVATWKPTVVGKVDFSIAGDIKDDATQHADSDDADLSVNGYKSSVNVKK